MVREYSDYNYKNSREIYPLLYDRIYIEDEPVYLPCILAILLMYGSVHL